MKKISIKENTDLNNLVETENTCESVLTFDPNIYDNIPNVLNSLFKKINGNEKKDIALLSLLTVFSGIPRNYKMLYGDKEEGCNLYTFLLGNPAQGKGFAAKFRRLGGKYNKYRMELKKQKFDDEKSQLEGEEEDQQQKQKRFFLSSDVSKASLAMELFENDGYGVFFLTEADTLTSANRSSFGDFSEILRIGFHGEHYSVNKKYFENGSMEIDSVFLSFLVTSTLDQCFTLLPKFEDGLFSRFSYYFVKGTKKFANVFDNSAIKELDNEIEKLSDIFLEIGKADELKEIITTFEFTEKQKKTFLVFNSIYKKQFLSSNKDLLGANFDRLALTTTRICMLLTYLRNYSKVQKLEQIYYCDDIDFNIGMSIMQSLEKHLGLLIFNYDEQNRNIHNQVSIRFSKDNQKADRQKEVELCIKLNKRGLSTREIARQVFGDEKRNSTVHKWIKKFTSTPFLFTETETPNKNLVDAKELLKQAKVSFFDNATSDPTDEYSLYKLVTQNIFKGFVEPIRECKQKDKRNALKKDIPAFTASGLFDSKRRKENLKKHSGFICIDIDKKGNEDIENFEALGNELSKILNVAFCSKSVSGDGYYVLIPIKDVEEHESYFEALEIAFSHLGIAIDKGCKDITRLRFVSYDEGKYLAEKAMLFHSTINKSKAENLSILNKINQPDLKRLLQVLEKDEKDITKTYDDWFAIGCALANTFNEKGLDYYKQFSQFHTMYKTLETEKQFEKCLSFVPQNNGYSLRTIFFIANKYNVKY